MIFWGSRTETINLGNVETKQCCTCEKERPFNLVLNYNWSHIYWLFGSVSKKNYLLLCDICSRGVHLDTKQVESSLNKSPIPFMRKHGASLFFGSLVILGIYAILKNTYKVL